MVNRLLLFAVAISFTTGAALAVWRGPPQVLAALDDETRDWVRELRNKYGGPCCDTADGYPVEGDGWDMAGRHHEQSRGGEGGGGLFTRGLPPRPKQSQKGGGRRHTFVKLQKKKICFFVWVGYEPRPY